MRFPKVAVVAIACFAIYSHGGIVKAQGADSDELSFLLELHTGGTRSIIEPKELAERCSRLLQSSAVPGLNRPALLFERAIAYLNLGQTDLARKDLAEVLKLEKGNLRARCLWASSLASREEACVELEKIINENPTFGLAFDEKARLLMGKGGLSVQMLRVSLECANSAIKCYEQDPGQVLSTATIPNAYLNRALIHYYAGHSEKALVDINRSFSLNPRPFLQRDKEAPFLIRGMIFTSLGKHKDAIADFQMALEVNPKSSEAQINLVKALMVANQKHVALHLAEEFAHSSGYALAAYDSYMRVLRELNRKEKALAELDDASLKKPQEAWPHLFACHVYVDMHDYERALQQADKGLRKKPNDSALIGQKVLIYAACPREKYRNGPKAKELALALCKNGRDGCVLPPEYLLAMACAECGDYSDALKALEKAQQYRSSQESQAFGTRLRMLFEKGTPYRCQE